MTHSCGPGHAGEYLSDCEVIDGYRRMARERSAGTVAAGAGELVIERAKAIRLLLLDVDGVMTDGTLLYSSSGEECKGFNTQDGFGLTLLHQAGIETGVITARRSEMVRRRAEELKMTHIHQGIRQKNEAFRTILHDTGFKPVEVAYMGDDWLDLVLLLKVGLALAPANAAFEVRERVHYVTPRPGGHGAVRDACDLLLSARGELPKLLQKYALG